ncbi:uncharacterized protein DS421_3g70490 [Arachis hypogaea]|nr:uncharacterized protein DS421_3g70490 [Arachis hypogaea]
MKMAQFRNSILDSQKFQSNDALNNVQDLDIMMLHNTLLYLTFFLRGLHARARAQEEEIFSLWEQVAVTCMKMLNEKCNLERQFSELRNGASLRVSHINVGKCRVGKLSGMVEGGKLSRVEGHKISVSKGA